MKEFSTDTTKGGGSVTMVYRIENYAVLQDKKKVKCITTNALRGCEHLWKIQVYPRGHEKSKQEKNTKGKYVCIGLVYAGTNDKSNPVTAKAILRTKTECREIPRQHFTKTNYSRFFPNFVKRKDIINKDCDKDGTLIITVELQVATETKAVWYPPVTFSDHNIVKDLYNCTETADCTFLIGASRTVFLGHTCIFYRRARQLYDLVVEEAAEEEISTAASASLTTKKSSRIVLHDVDAPSFEALLKFIYTGHVPTFNNTDNNQDIYYFYQDMANAKLILSTADQFSCTELKLCMESLLVEQFLVISTAASFLLFADAHTCPFLKERAIAIYTANPKALMEANSLEWAKVKESNDLLVELLLHTNNNMDGTSTSNRRHPQLSSMSEYNAAGILLEEEQIEDFDVTALRDHLQNVGLPMDGSRIMLEDRLKEYVRCAHNNNNNDNDDEEDDDQDDDEDDDEEVDELLW
mmetsp:Transcript_28506/g.31953  ORF Transcript_28506/g.31953 Transcript_28506/m.31953 type:complete len:466 (-) Transcript_28506:56-1453(-)